MDKIQKSKVNMYKVVTLFFTNFLSVFTGFTLLLTEITGFTGSTDSLSDEIGKQTVNNTGITAAKNVLVMKAIKLLVQSARKSKTWAKNAHNDALITLFDVQISTFSGMSQSMVLAALAPIRDAINDNISSLAPVRVLPANVTAIDAAIVLAAASIGKPKQASDAKVVSTAQIVMWITNCDEYLAKIDDLLIPEYEDTNAAMVDTYKLARELQVIGASATGLHAVCREVGLLTLLQNVTMTIVELSKSAVSDIDGLAEIDRFKPGKYHVTFSLDGYQDYAIIIEFLLGKVVSIDILMVKLAVA